MLSIYGVSDIIVVGTEGDDERLELAKNYGATMTLNSSRDDVDAIVKGMGDGYGADLVVDTAGVSPTLKLSLDIVRPAGHITKIGWGPKPVNFSLDKIIEKSITLKGHFSHTWDVWEKCITMMGKKQVDLMPLITHELPITEWEQAFHLVESKQAMKVVLKPV
jgi:alcohol dehydrogenase/L-iditol 2-dehydrogenase